MGKIDITFSDVTCYGTKDKSTTLVTNDVTVSSDVNTGSVWFKVGSDIKPYKLNLVNVDFLKKMYQPTEVNAEIHLELADNSKWVSVSKSTLQTAFKHVKVELACDQKTVGDDYYVHEVQAIYHQSSMHINLKIFSLDKLLTLRQASRAFVAKKLGTDILANEIKNYIKPWTINVSQTLLEKQNRILTAVNGLSVDNLKILNSSLYKVFSTPSWTGDALPEEVKSVISLINEWKKENDNQSNQTPMTCSTSNMQVLNYSGTSEHIHPYLVQYNESFYDFLARTANRWGEFMYYEDGNLNIGYDKTNTGTVGTYADRYYFNIYDVNQKTDLSVSKAGNYDVQASNEDQFIKNTLKKSPNEVSGIMYCPNGKFDKVAMKKLANLLKLDKSLPTYIGYEIADDVFDVASKSSSVAALNDQFNDKYFTEEEKDGAMVLSSKAPGVTEQRDSDNTKYNQFTELNTKFDDTKYLEILTKEQKAGLNALQINYDTNYPNLKLGQIITIDSENYIVVEVACKKKTSVDYTLEEDKDKDPKEYKLKKTITSNYVFNVVALAQDGTNDKVFYPTIIPIGHIRQAEPQMATITDAGDPTGSNQVRVVFPWQYETLDEKNKEAINPFMDKYPSLNPAKPDDAAGDATPWLKFATNASGSPVVGKHYKGNKVLVGFIDGNVERPYVLGGLEAKGDSSADVVQTTPGGHSLKINDDPAGVTKFMTGMFLPGWKTLSSFVPQMNQIETNMDADSKLGGGFELTDNYGIYKISGSTDGRNVTVASPWGDIAINAFTGITISAPNGDISIKGKNVSIEAGNNLTLKSGMNVNYHFAQKKTTAGGCVSQFLLDVAAAVARRMTEKAITIVDLSIIRSMWDIVMRPQEGCLTVKSNRYLKLASGNNECAYPAEGYSDFKKNNIYDKFVNKREAKVASGLAIGCPGEGSAMREIFETISPMVDDLDQKYKKVWNKCFDLKVKLSQRFSLLDAWVNDPTKRAIQGSNFNDLYDNKLKADLWKGGKYEPFQESDLNKWLSDEVKVEGELDNIVSDTCIHRHESDFPKVQHDNHSLRLAVIAKRKELRKNVLKAMNELRKEICNLLNLEFDPADINKKLSWFVLTPAPKDYKKKMNTSFSREKCADSRYYKFLDNDDRMSLATKIGDTDLALGANDKKYMKRVVAMNMLDQLGFRDDMRKPLVVSGPIPPKPDANDSATVIDDDIWKNYVNSISGIPPLGRDTTAIAGGMEAALDAAWSKINIWGSAIEWFTWGEGKKGQILFNGGNGTLKLEKKGFDDITPLDPKAKYLTDDDLSESEQHTVNSFLEHMKLGLRTL